MDPRAATIRQEAFLSLSKRMDDIKPAPLILEALLSGLQCWIAANGMPTDFTANIQAALDHQLKLGYGTNSFAGES
jgi:hypothetical protein